MSRKGSSDNSLPLLPPTKQSPSPPAAFTSPAKKNANRSSKSKAKNPGDGGGIAERVTSEPIVPTAASTDAAAGNGRAASAMQIVNIVHDTRQQISELRERTEKALAQMQQANNERRQQLADIQSAKNHLNMIHEQIANIISQNFAAGSRNHVTPFAAVPDKSDATD